MWYPCLFSDINSLLIILYFFHHFLSWPGQQAYRLYYILLNKIKVYAWFWCRFKLFLHICPFYIIYKCAPIRIFGWSPYTDMEVLLIHASGLCTACFCFKYRLHQSFLIINETILVYLCYFVIKIVVLEYCRLILRFLRHTAMTAVVDFSNSGSTFDRHTWHHAAGANHVFQQSTLARAQRTTWPTRSHTMGPVMFITWEPQCITALKHCWPSSQRWLAWMPHPELKTETAFKCLRLRCPEASGANNEAKIITLKNEDRDMYKMDR